MKKAGFSDRCHGTRRPRAGFLLWIAGAALGAATPAWAVTADLALAQVRTRLDADLPELVLDRPARHNAFDADLMLGLLDCLDELAHTHGQALADRPHALLLRAEGKHFCAGADLNWMRNLAHADFEHNREDARVLARLMQTLDELPFPTVALVQGETYNMKITYPYDLRVAKSLLEDETHD